MTQTFEINKFHNVPGTDFFPLNVSPIRDWGRPSPPQFSKSSLSMQAASPPCIEIQKFRSRLTARILMIVYKRTIVQIHVKNLTEQ